MALYDPPRDRRFNPMNAGSTDPSRYASTLLPIILAAALAVVLLAMFFPSSGTRVGDTSAGPSVKTVVPMPAPSTSPAVPTPNPTAPSP